MVFAGVFILQLNNFVYINYTFGICIFVRLKRDRIDYNKYENYKYSILIDYGFTL
jgi:hypothetical protein